MTRLSRMLSDDKIVVLRVVASQASQRQASTPYGSGVVIGWTCLVLFECLRRTDASDAKNFLDVCLVI